MYGQFGQVHHTPYLIYRITSRDWEIASPYAEGRPPPLESLARNPLRAKWQGEYSTGGDRLTFLWRGDPLGERTSGRELKGQTGGSVIVEGEKITKGIVLVAH